MFNCIQPRLADIAKYCSYENILSFLTVLLRESLYFINSESAQNITFIAFANHLHQQSNQHEIVIKNLDSFARLLLIINLLLSEFTQGRYSRTVPIETRKLFSNQVSNVLNTLPQCKFHLANAFILNKLKK